MILQYTLIDMLYDVDDEIENELITNTEVKISESNLELSHFLLSEDWCNEWFPQITINFEINKVRS